MVASRLYEAEPPQASPEYVADGLAIIRADNGLLSIDKAENQVIRRPGVALRRFAQDFDLCLIDTPPLLGVRLMASLAAADYVVTPVSVGLYELAEIKSEAGEVGRSGGGGGGVCVCVCVCVCVGGGV